MVSSFLPQTFGINQKTNVCKCMLYLSNYFVMIIHPMKYMVYSQRTDTDATRAGGVSMPDANPQA